MSDLRTARPSFARLALLAAPLLALAPHASQAQRADRPRLTLEAIFDSETFTGETFEGGRWAEEGPVVTYIEPRPGGGTDLMSYNLETDARTRLIDGSKLRAPDVDRLIEIEDYAYSRDRRRVLLFTDTERVWRLNTKGYYYIYDLERERLTPLALRERGFQMFAKFSPDGRRVAFVRERNLFLTDLASGTETQLTDTGAEGGVINGTFDWVYEEEFGLRDGWAWSPDGRHIAFFQLDETGTREYLLPDLRPFYPEVTRFRYPKAGETNSEVRVGVIDLERGNATRFFDTGTWQAGGDSLEYIARMGWTPRLEGGFAVWMMRLDRDQNDLDLLYGDPATGRVRVVLEEREPSYIDVESDKLAYLSDGEHFVWRSETDGFAHLYLHRNSGERLRAITSGAWEVTEVEGVDEERNLVYFTATRESPLQRHLYRTALFARGGASAAPVKITTEPGVHEIDLSPDGRFFLDEHSSSTAPPVTELHRADGALVKVLEDNAALKRTLARYDLPVPEFTTVPAADGTPLNAFVIRPKDFDPSREYPLLLYVYGGPGSQTVIDGWGGYRYLWHAYLAEELGLIVASVDNRGTGARGKAFEAATYRDLGALEAQDQIAAARHLAALPYVDEDRVGIYGWSYGGYMTLMSVLSGEGPRTFRVGMAGAPVTDWRLYDTIYTERYMSTPQRNPEGYDRSAPVQLADRLRDEQELLIVHGDLDDNVHFQNTLRMVHALQAAGKQFDFMVYPGHNHGISGATRLHLYTLFTDYAREHLVEVPANFGSR